MSLHRVKNKESLGYVLKRHTAVFVILVFLFVSTTGGQLILQSAKSHNANLIRAGNPVGLGLTPIDFQEESSSNNMGTVLSETEPQGIDYFYDALFIGDSLTDGIRIYLSTSGIQAVSTKGVNTHTALTEQFHPIGDQLYTMIDAIEYYKPRKVYIMLGTNGLGWETVEWNLQGYEVLIDEILRRAPGCYVIIQSIPPTTEERALSTPAYSRENIMQFNAGLQDIALRKGVYFLDVNQALSNDLGYLDTSIAAPDGYHMQPSGYQLWYDYIVSHAVLGEMAFHITPDGQLRFSVQEFDETVTSDPAAIETTGI